MTGLFCTLSVRFFYHMTVSSNVNILSRSSLVIARDDLFRRHAWHSRGHDHFSTVAIDRSASERWIRNVISLEGSDREIYSCISVWYVFKLRLYGIILYEWSSLIWWYNNSIILKSNPFNYIIRITRFSYFIILQFSNFISLDERRTKDPRKLNNSKKIRLQIFQGTPPLPPLFINFLSHH